LFFIFFFLDKKERKNQDKTISCTQAKLLRVLSGGALFQTKLSAQYLDELRFAAKKPQP
jgi:hypothetical protein